MVIGRLFEGADVLLLLRSADLESVDDYLIKKVRSITDIQELTVVPIYEFRLLSSFNFVTDSRREAAGSSSSLEPEELLFFMTKIDVASTKDDAVYEHILSIDSDDETIPLMTGHTFHSKDFDIVLFFLAKHLESAWRFIKALRAVDGVLDTDVGLIAHLEGLIPLKRFKELVTPTSVIGRVRRKAGKRKIAK